ncbi:MAG: glycosyltransferase [Deltaproteobacteria bacterium]|nr:glycosyltransferase [Deltaproteobacteria bacterium]
MESPRSAHPRTSRALVLMVKVPYPGTCKTRLSPPLSPREAADLYRCFLVDLAREMPQWGVDADLIVAWADDDRRGGEPSSSDDLPPALESLFGSAPCRALRQEGPSLTARMVRVFETLQHQGYETIVMRNSDSPHLPEAVVSEAFVALERAPGSVVIGPDLDGGYYLVGMSGGPPNIFPPVMSTATVLEQTVENVQSLGRALHLLEPHLDVDTADDLVTFWLEFGGRADVRHWATWQALEGHDAWERFAEETLTP